MDKLFRIGNFCFRTLCDEDFSIPPNFLLFETEREVSEYTYHIQFTDTLPFSDGNVIARRPDLIVSRTSAGENRLLGIKGRTDFYATYSEISNAEAKILLSLDQIKNLSIDPVFTSLFALEQRMIEKDSLILHCAYIVYHGKAILFSAPSGTGKSTQADLWRQYRDSDIINGDRALLRKTDNKWIACGWPVCGSSEICKCKDLPIHTIVMLEQGKINYAKKLSPVQAFAQLYGQITINQWNADFVERAISNLEDLISLVPVYQLTCDISEDAVSCLEHTLFTER